MPAGASHLPQAVVGLVPVALEVVHERELDVPSIVVVTDPGVASERQAVRRLSPHVELQLSESRTEPSDLTGAASAVGPVNAILCRQGKAYTVRR